MLLQKVIKRAVVKKRVKQKNPRRSIKPSHDFWYKIQVETKNKNNDEE